MQENGTSKSADSFSKQNVSDVRKELTGTVEAVSDTCNFLNLILLILIQVMVMINDAASSTLNLCPSSLNLS